jgi:hypothetical protein
MAFTSRQKHPEGIISMPCRRGDDGILVFNVRAEPAVRLISRQDVEAFATSLKELNGNTKDAERKLKDLYSDICTGHVHFDRNQSLELLGTIFAKYGAHARGIHLASLGATRDATKSSSLICEQVVEPEKKLEAGPAPIPQESFSTRLRRADLPLVQMSFVAAVLTVLTCIATFKPLPKGEVRLPAPSSLALKAAKAVSLKSLPPSETYITNAPEVKMYMRGLTPEEAAAFRAKHPSKYGDGMQYITNITK